MYEIVEMKKEFLFRLDAYEKFLKKYDACERFVPFRVEKFFKFFYSPYFSFLIIFSKKKSHEIRGIF